MGKWWEKVQKRFKWGKYKEVVELTPDERRNQWMGEVRFYTRALYVIIIPILICSLLNVFVLTGGSMKWGPQYVKVENHEITVVATEGQEITYYDHTDKEARTSVFPYGRYKVGGKLTLPLTAEKEVVSGEIQTEYEGYIYFGDELLGTLEEVDKSNIFTMQEVTLEDYMHRAAIKKNCYEVLAFIKGWTQWVYILTAGKTLYLIFKKRV